MVTKIIIIALLLYLVLGLPLLQREQWLSSLNSKSFEVEYVEGSIIMPEVRHGYTLLCYVAQVFS